MIRISEEQFIEAREQAIGVCIFCQEMIEGIDPASHREKCSACGKRGLCGIEDLLVTNMIEIVTLYEHVWTVPSRTEQLAAKLREEWKEKK